MRGRTLDDAFVLLVSQFEFGLQLQPFLNQILDELKTFSFVHVLYFELHLKLPKGVKSGLKEAIKNLRGVKGINIMELDQSDVVRHPLVSIIFIPLTPRRFLIASFNPLLTPFGKSI
jgi:phosphate starvation-inducible PhoH-like protein